MKEIQPYVFSAMQIVDDFARETKEVKNVLLDEGNTAIRIFRNANSRRFCARNKRSKKRFTR